MAQDYKHTIALMPSGRNDCGKSRKLDEDNTT